MNPGWWTAALLASLPWLQGGATPLGLFITHTLIFVLAGLAMARAVSRGGLELGLGWEAAAGALVVAVCAISFSRGDYLFGSFLSLWNVLMASLLFVVLLVPGPSVWRVSATVVASASAAQALLVLVMPAPQNLTSSASFANANQLAAYLNIGTFAAIGLALEAIPKGRRAAAIGLLAIAGLNTTVLISVGARGGLLALVAVGGGAGAAWVWRRRGLARPLVLGGLTLLAVVSAAGVAARFERIRDPYQFDRLRIWGASLRAAQDYPVLGMGPGMFERRGYQYNFPLERETFRFSKTPTSTHSVYLQTLVETGTIGLLSVALFVLFLVSRLWRERESHHPRGIAALLALVACLVHGLVDTPFDVPAVTLSLMALVVPLLRSSGPAQSPLYLAIPARRSGLAWALALAGAIVPAYLCGVALPYAAHASFEVGARRGQPGAPAEALTTAVKLNPYNPLYLATRADLTWRRAGPLDPPALAAARLDLEEARRLDPGNPEILLGLARLQRRACVDIGADEACTRRAERLYRDVFSLGLRDPRPRIELASFLMAQDKLEAALREVEAALELEPRFLAARLALARVLLDTGRIEEARGALSRLEALKVELASYEPKNGYERDLVWLDGAALREAEARLR